MPKPDMSSAFLPKLEQLASVPKPAASLAGWGRHVGMPVLAEYSNALQVAESQARAERLKSLPSPWARMLLFEQALFAKPVPASGSQAAIKGHPAHQQVRDEWRGLLGLVALSEILHTPLAYSRVELPMTHDDDREPSALELLRHFIPEGELADRWKYHGILFVGDACVGATSPRTLVYTPLRASRVSGVPFVKDGRLTDPTHYYSQDATTLRRLWTWAETLRTNLGAPTISPAADSYLGRLPASGGQKETPRVEKLLGLLADWRLDLERALAGLGEAAVPAQQDHTPNSELAAEFGNIAAAAAVFKCLAPIPGSMEQTTICDFLVRRAADQPLIIVKPGRFGRLCEAGAHYSGHVQLPGGMQKMEDGRLVAALTDKQFGEHPLDVEAMWQPRIVEVKNAVRGSANLLTASDRSFLLPFKPELLPHFSGEELASWTRLEAAPDGAFRVILDVPVQNGRRLRFDRTYSSTDVVTGFSTPHFAMWPDFVAHDWSDYFYVSTQPSKAGGITLAPYPSDAARRTDDHFPNRWWTSKRPISAWLASADDNQGLLVLQLPDPLEEPHLKWRMSIDFGSTHTRAFYVDADAAHSGIQELPLSPHRARRIFSDGSPIALHFFADEFAQELGSELWSLVYLPKGRPHLVPDNWLPSDGLLFLEPSITPAALDNTRSNLKWHKKDSVDAACFQNYLVHLVLALRAEARIKKAEVVELRTAVPSVLPQDLRNRHRLAWQNIERRVSVPVPRAITESHAVAKFFHYKGQAAANVNLVALDIGGSTSDLAIWINQNPVVKDSVRLAGDILPRLLDQDPRLRNTVNEAASEAQLIEGGLAWRNSGNAPVFTGLLHLCGRRPNGMKSLGLALKDGSDPGGTLLLSHVVFLFAALGYVMGCFARSCGGSHTNYYLRFAGRGSQYLDWLEAFGPQAEKRVPGDFFRLGLAGTPNVSVDVESTGGDAKKEVGIGLLVDLEMIDRDTGPERETTLLEHGYKAGGQVLEWNRQLDQTLMRTLECRSLDPAVPFDPSELSVLRTFVNEFSHHPVTKYAATSLGISAASLDDGYRDHLHGRLLGAGSPVALLRQGGQASADALIEPVIVTELKALLEHCTKQLLLFSE